MRATYYAAWWPSIDQVVYDGDRVPLWHRESGQYVDPDTGEVLPTLGAGRRPARRTRARGVVRHPAGHQGHPRRLAPTRPGRCATCASTSPRPSPPPTPPSTASGSRAGRAVSRTWSGTSTGCTSTSGCCPAPPRARTGCGTASNRPTPARAWCPAAAPPPRTTGRTSAWAGGACWCPGPGPARPSPSTAPTAGPSSPKCWRPPGSRPRTRPDWPPPTRCPTGEHATSGKTCPPASWTT